MRGACSTCGRRRGAYRILVVKPEGKRPPGRPRRRWEDNIKMHLQEVGCGEWTGSEEGQVAGTCKCGYETSVCIKCGGFLEKLKKA
jgi:hypothetical protein